MSTRLGKKHLLDAANIGLGAQIFEDCGYALHHLGAGAMLLMMGSNPAMMAATVIILGRTRSTAPVVIAA